MDVTLKKLKHLIAEARHHEQQSGAMVRYIQRNLSSLHGAIAIPSSSPEKSLMSFVEEYIDSAPEHINALYSLAKEAKIDVYVQPFLDLCCIYFTNPPELLASYSGLRDVLNKAYLAHRLMEELNDQVMSLSGGAALAPMDMSMANIISHDLIGDELANQLDHLVLLAIETTAVDKSIFQKQDVIALLEKRRLNGWAEVTERWPCFTQDCSINLQMNL